MPKCKKPGLINAYRNWSADVSAEEKKRRDEIHVNLFAVCRSNGIHISFVNMLEEIINELIAAGETKRTFLVDHSNDSVYIRGTQFASADVISMFHAVRSAWARTVEVIVDEHSPDLIIGAIFKAI
ncbi:MAG: hypothetical protein Q8Q48_03975 [Candidatus Staskawiczbacteria bacterium]|nr:hypothetical protein [Candidatus Staskawiczbacteria bacterium]